MRCKGLGFIYGVVTERSFVLAPSGGVSRNCGRCNIRVQAAELDGSLTPSRGKASGTPLFPEVEFYI